MFVKKSLSLICALGVLVAAIGEYAHAFDFEEHGINKAEFIYDTEFEGVKSSIDGKYAAVETGADGNEVCIPADLIEIDLTEDINLQIKGLNLPPEIVDAINAKAASVNMMEEKKIVIMAPKDNLRDTSGNTGDINTYGWTYDTYKGYPVKSYKLFAYSISNNTHKFKGTKSKNIASAMFTLAITAGSKMDKTVNFVSSGCSIFEQFCKIFNVSEKYITGASSDNVDVKVTYDIIEQFTYVQLGQVWKYCYYSQNVTVISTNVYTYLYNSQTRTGQETNILNSEKTTQVSANYYSPYEQALKYLNASSYGAEYIYFKASGYSYKLTSSPENSI